MNELEYTIFQDIRSKVAVYTKELQKIADILAEIDVFLSLAQVAVENNYSRPNLPACQSPDGIGTAGREVESWKLEIKAGRHPVVEKTLGPHVFVPNDTFMDDQNSRFLLITGPNMAGKSTYMRQVALIVLLAQTGSFVPATSASISLVDRIFTRVGALDDMFAGQSTFMVEMVETANILNNATAQSLIILDEIGRGTSTFDGMSIACAVGEFIYTKIKAKALFATHYHELTQLEKKHKGMVNLNTAVREEGDQITFLYRIVPGSADQSYGIQVAQLAGLPKEVIARAKEVYDTLEMVENDLGITKEQMGLF